MNNILEKAIKSLKNLGLEHDIHQLAYTQGSFRVNLKVILKNPPMFLDINDVSNYIGEYIKACSNLSNSSLKSINEIDNDSNFEHLKKEISHLYKKNSIQTDEKTFNNLLDDVIETFPIISNIILLDKN